MKTLTIAFTLFFTSLTLFAQTGTDSGADKTSSTKVYMSFSTEMIFSFANIDNNGNSNGNIMRWAPVFNPQTMVNIDFNKHFGLFTGLAIRNVGFIYKDPDSNYSVKYKYRSYNLGIPVGFKVGKMNGFMFFGGYEIEFPFVYKEKKFVNDVKMDDKVYEWFSDRVEPVQQSVLAGVQFPYGATVKFKYYFTNFLNKTYEENGVKPYDFDANVFYFSLAWNLFANYKAYAPKDLGRHKN